MRRRLPRFDRVLCCLPLRGGIIAMVYVNLLVTGAALAAFGFLSYVKAFIRMFTVTLYEQIHRTYRSKVHLMTFFPLLMLVALAELVMMVVALIGLHKNKVKLIKLYQHYTSLLTISVFFLRMLDVSHFQLFLDIAATTIFISFKVYYILLTRSLVKNMEETDEIIRKEDQLEMAVPPEDNSLEEEMSELTHATA